MIITAKGQSKFDKLSALEVNGKYIRPEQKFNLWVFKTVIQYPDLASDFLGQYVEVHQKSVGNMLEIRDFFRYMLPQ